MRKERVLSIITTIYFLIYSIVILMAGTVLLYVGHNFEQITDLALGVSSKADGAITVLAGFFSMFGVFGQVAVYLLAASIGGLFLICAGIFVHSCICLRKTSDYELVQKRLKRDALIKMLFYILIGILLGISGLFMPEEPGSVIGFLVIFVLPCILSFLTFLFGMTSCSA